MTGHGELRLADALRDLTLRLGSTDIAHMSRTLFHLMLMLAALTSAIRPAGLSICVEADGVARVEAAGNACAAERPCAEQPASPAAYHEAHGCEDYAVIDAGHARPDEASPLTLPATLDHIVSTRPASPPDRASYTAGSRGAPPRAQSPRGDVLRI